MIRTIIALVPNGCSRALFVRVEILQNKSVWPVLEERQCEAVDLGRVSISVCIPFEGDVTISRSRAFGDCIEQTLGIVATSIDIKVVPVRKHARNKNLAVLHWKMRVVPCIAVDTVQTCDSEDL